MKKNSDQEFADAYMETSAKIYGCGCAVMLAVMLLSGLLGAIGVMFGR